jgi:RNase H-fold protein (predicted Holliday junction resolvase)
MSANGFLALLQDVQPDVVVVGWPLLGAGRSRCKPDEFRAFVAELEREGNLLVEVVPAPPATQERGRQDG